MTSNCIKNLEFVPDFLVEISYYKVNNMKVTKNIVQWLSIIQNILP